MTFKTLSVRQVEDFFERVLGPAPNASERSRRIVASCRIDAGAEITGLTRDELERVRLAIHADASATKG